MGDLLDVEFIWVGLGLANQPRLRISCTYCPFYCSEFLRIFLQSSVFSYYSKEVRVIQFRVKFLTVWGPDPHQLLIKTLAGLLVMLKLLHEGFGQLEITIYDQFCIIIPSWKELILEFASSYHNLCQCFLFLSRFSYGV